MKLKKFYELYVNRDDPNTPFHSSDDPKKWSKEGRYSPDVSSIPYLTIADDLEKKLSELGLYKEDLNHFRLFLSKLKNMNRDYNNNDQLYTDILIMSRILKANRDFIDKLMNIK